MQEIRTTGDLRGFLGNVLLGIRDGSVNAKQADSISKVAAQINQSLAVEVNTALQLERMGKDRPLAGSMMLGSFQDAQPALPTVDEPEETAPDEDDDGLWAESAAHHIGRLDDAKAIDGFVTGHCDRLELLMETRPELHAKITVAINEAHERIAPSELGRIKRSLRDDLQWCDQCDMRVTPDEVAGCKSRHCSVKGKIAA